MLKNRIRARVKGENSRAASKRESLRNFTHRHNQPKPDSSNRTRSFRSILSPIIMVRRRSKRKAAVLESLTKEHGGLRRSKRKEKVRQNDFQLYGEDYGILPSD